MEQKGSMLLKVVSIIMMVGGIIGAVASFIGAVIAGVASAAMAQPEVSDAVNSALGS